MFCLSLESLERKTEWLGSGLLLNFFSARFINKHINICLFRSFTNSSEMIILEFNTIRLSFPLCHSLSGIRNLDEIEDHDMEKN